MILQFLNRRNSLRQLSDQQFEDIVENLAEELYHIDYKHSYDNQNLHKDWLKLCEYDVSSYRHNGTAIGIGKHSSSTVRVGMKLCEHFFPNYFKIKNNKGVSFENSWTKENLVKVLKWNRKSHSTPYLSELRRGIYFCCGLTKNTMYRPHLAKSICFRQNLTISNPVVLDPCCGWGGRLLGTLAKNQKYIGFEPNEETFENLNRMLSFLNIDKSRYQLYCDGAENIPNYDFEKVHLVLTSPPYFNLEIYSDSEKQSENMFTTYEDWRDKWLFPVIQNCLDRLHEYGSSAWNVHDIGKMKLISDVHDYHKKQEWEHTYDIGLTSPKRQSNDKTHKKKNSDLTRIFEKNPSTRDYYYE